MRPRDLTLNHGRMAAKHVHNTIFLKACVRAMLPQVAREITGFVSAAEPQVARALCQPKPLCLLPRPTLAFSEEGSEPLVQLYGIDVKPVLSATLPSDQGPVGLPEGDR